MIIKAIHKLNHKEAELNFATIKEAKKRNPDLKDFEIVGEK